MMDTFMRTLKLDSSGRKRAQLYMTLTQFDREHGGVQQYLESEYCEQGTKWKVSRSGRLYSLKLSMALLDAEWGEDKLVCYNTDEEGRRTMRAVLGDSIFMKYNRATQRIFLSYKVDEWQWARVGGRECWMLVG